MKQIVLILLFLMIATKTTIAQKGNKVEQAKIAFITQKLELTSSEAEKFWPIYNEFRLKTKELKKDRRGELLELKNAKDISEKDAEEALVFLMINEQKLLDLRKEYFVKFKQVISVKKVLLLIQAEREFNKELLSYIKK